MLQGIICFQYLLMDNQTGSIQSEFIPIVIILNSEKYKGVSYKEILTERDLFALYYTHTTRRSKDYDAKTQEIEDIYMGRFMETDFQVLSYFKQTIDKSQYLTLIIFDAYDDIDIFQQIIKNNSERINIILNTLVKAKITNQIDLVPDIISQLKLELEFTRFQVERLFKLDPIQKAALIFNDEKRYYILEQLRKNPIYKNELLLYFQSKGLNINVDLLLTPLLELKLVRRDWIKGKRNPQTGRIENQGEYLFLTKDIILAQTPNKDILAKIKNVKKDIFSEYETQISDFFSKYDPVVLVFKAQKQLADLLLDPDIYDFISLLRKNFYPLDKLPKILSEWADLNYILSELKKHKIITEITDKDGKKWVLLLTDIKPLTIFPEFLLNNLKNALKRKDKMVNHEVAKKALDLLELSYFEKLNF